MNKLFSGQFDGAYQASALEPDIIEFWEKSKFFHAQPDKDTKPFTVATPPPNVTGELHVGHTTPYTFIDIYGRYNRMLGHNVLLIPGTDHAAIAAQNVVEKDLSKKGLSRHKLGREAFLKEMWNYVNEYKPKIESQIKAVGASVDWSRNHFTLDEDLSIAVFEAFYRLEKNGLIYQGEYMVNWCPRCGTALSDDEVEHHDEQTKLYWFKYGPLSIATSRPETMFGDTAVAVNPKDKRYSKLVGKKIEIQTPLGKTSLPVIADEIVEPKFGSGAVKVTPAHDHTDFKLGQKHNLEFKQVIDDRGRMTENCGEYAGLKRTAARTAVVQKMQALGLLEKTTEYSTRIPHCYRCENIVEPLISSQWFIKVTTLAQSAKQAVKSGKIKITPKRFEKVYFNWMDNIHDWCISRQLWWGHRLPVWFCTNKIAPSSTKQTKNYTVSTHKPEKCSVCGECEMKQSEDVLDTWFSSGLWPFATLGWPKQTEDFEYFYPTSMMITGKDIIFFWVARMIMLSEHLAGSEPFSEVLIHGLILDSKGKKMSKSKGNSIHPMPMIEKYGADALRLSVVIGNTLGNDLSLSEDKIRAYRNFSNKIWNATRFVISSLDGFEPSDLVGSTTPKLGPGELTQLKRLHDIVLSTDGHLKAKRIALAAEELYHFFWHYFCDECIEQAKSKIQKPKSEEEKKAAQYALYRMLEVQLKLLHPFVPFVTEACWQKLRANSLDIDREESISITKWPIAKSLI
jgi:valyl-tRNA synthetase